MTSPPPLALERLNKLRWLFERADATQRHLQLDRNAAIDAHQKAVFGFEQAKRARIVGRPPSAVYPGEDPINRPTPPRGGYRDHDTVPVWEQANREVQRARAQLDERVALLNEAGARAAALGDVLTRCRSFLREHYNWREAH